MVVIICLILLSICSELRLFAWAQQPPKLTPLTLPKDLVVGTEVRLTCTVAVGDTPLEILWFRNDKRVVFSATLSEQTGTYSSTLTFKPLNEEHAGRYTCVASNAAGKDNASVDVVVNVAPEWVDKPADLKIPEGGVALIHCQAKGSPVPRVNWSHDNGDRVSTLGAIPGGGYDKYRVYSNGTLIVRDVQKSDSGMYTCDVSNGIGIGLKKAVAVTVYTVARAQVLTQHISAESGHTVNLTCIATGDHPVTVIWMKGDKTITSNGQLYDRVLVSSDVQKERLVSSLVMKHVAVGDAGHYVCVVHNEYGEDRKSIRLNVLQPPANPTDVEVSDVWSRSARIRWKSPLGSPVLSYQVRFWSHRDDKAVNQSIQGGVTTALIRDLHPATEYRLTIVAINSAGSSEPSPTVRFATTQEEPHSPPVNVRIEKSGATFVLVTWSPPPESDWNGELLGYYVGYTSASDSSKKHFYSFHTVAANSRSFTLRGLAKDTSYAIVVKAFNIVGSSPPSAPLTVTTLDGDFPPAPLLSVSAVDAGSLRLSWMFSAPVTQRVTGYTLHYRQLDDSWKEVFVASAKQTSYLLSGLDPSQPCQVYLVAHSRLGSSEPSDILNIPLSGPQTPTSSPPDDSRASSNSELRAILYTVVPIVTATALVVVLVVAICFCLYVRKTRLPPPPVYADFPRDADFTFASHEVALHDKGLATPCSTMPRSTDNEGIYESIVDMRTLSLRRKQASQNSLKKGSMDLVDVCVV